MVVIYQESSYHKHRRISLSSPMTYEHFPLFCCSLWRRAVGSGHAMLSLVYDKTGNRQHFWPQNN
jgi:hypothetical protein